MAQTETRLRQRMLTPPRSRMISAGAAYGVPVACPMER